MTAPSHVLSLHRVTNGWVVVVPNDIGQPITLVFGDGDGDEAASLRDALYAGLEGEGYTRSKHSGGVTIEAHADGWEFAQPLDP